MLGLAKTCMKLKLSFYEFIGARLGIPGPKIPPLASLIRPTPAQIECRSPGNLPRLHISAEPDILEKLPNLTLNQRVHGSSPCAPTIKKSKIYIPL